MAGDKTHCKNHSNSFMAAIFRPCKFGEDVGWTPCGSGPGANVRMCDVLGCHISASNLYEPRIDAEVTSTLMKTIHRLYRNKKSLWSLRRPIRHERLRTEYDVLLR